jgi:hypothetical protein
MEQQVIIPMKPPLLAGDKSAFTPLIDRHRYEEDKRERPTGPGTLGHRWSRLGRG